MCFVALEWSQRHLPGWWVETNCARLAIGDAMTAETSEARKRPEAFMMSKWNMGRSREKSGTEDDKGLWLSKCC